MKNEAVRPGGARSCLSAGPVRVGRRQTIIVRMTRPVFPSKVLLVADRRVAPSSRKTTPVRRYRLARLRFDSRPAGAESRFEYLKRSYD